MRAENGEIDSDWSDASDALSTLSCPPIEGDLWCGVLTVEAISTSQDGFFGATGGLSDATFSVGPRNRNYAIDGVSVDNSTSTNPGQLLFSLTGGLATAHKAKLELHVGSEQFAFSAAQYLAGNHSYQWTGTSLDWSSTSTVTLRLRAPNNAPVFADASVPRAVEENSAAGTDVGAAVTATDADSGDTLEYSLEGTDAASFDIDDSSGQIQTVSGEDYNHEAKHSYSVTVKASDSIASDTIAVDILVRDVAEKSAKPDKPTLAAVPDSTTSLDASWTKPDLNGGPEITGYALQYREGATGSWEDFGHTGDDVTATITGLTANTEYQARVRAENGEIDSDWSDPSDAVSTNPIAPPQITEVYAGEAGLTILWAPVRDDHPAATYDLRYIDLTPTSGESPDPDDPDAWTVVENVWRRPAAGPPLYVLQGLENFHEYLVAVRAVQPGGNQGLWSDRGRSVSPPAPHPDNASQEDPDARKATDLPFDIPVSGFLQDAETNQAGIGDSDYFSFDLDRENSAIVCYTTGDVDTAARIVVDGDVDNVIRVAGPGRPEDGRNFRFAMNESDFSGAFSLRVHTRLDQPRDEFGMPLPGFGVPMPGGAYALECKFAPETNSIGDAQNIRFYAETAVSFEAPGDREYLAFEVDGSSDILLYSRGGADAQGRVVDEGGNVVPFTFSDDRILDHERPKNFAILLEKEDLSPGRYSLEMDRWPRINPFTGDTSKEIAYVVVYPSVAPESGAVEDALPVNLGFLGGELGDPRAGTLDSPSDAAIFQFDLDEPNHVFIRAVTSSDQYTMWDPSSTRLRMELLTEGGSTVDMHQRFEPFEHDGYYLQESLTSTTFLDAGRYYLRLGLRQDEDEDQFGDPVPFTPLTYFVLALTDPSQIEIHEECSSLGGSSTDPLRPCQWHLDAVRVQPAWDAGYSGAGIEVLVSDDGIDDLHEDLKPNLHPSRVFDFRAAGTNIFQGPHAHGSAVAGVIAARDNDLGGRGVAPRANLRAHNLIAVPTAGFVVETLSRDAATVAIMNNSWGRVGFYPHLPLEPISEALPLAIEEGITRGYGGRGVLYVKSAGNAARAASNANYEPMQTHYGIVAVGATREDGIRQPYSEIGSNLWVSGPSGLYPPAIYTTDNYNRYTDAFNGTSAAAPVVSGVAALVREANRSLTWRDVKLILASTAQKVDPGSDRWVQAGRKYDNHSEHYDHSIFYGFGLVDAAAAVELATRWTNLPPFIETAGESAEEVHLGSSRVSESKLTLAGDVDFTEWVSVELTVDIARFRSYANRACVAIGSQLIPELGGNWCCYCS